MPLDRLASLLGRRQQGLGLNPVTQSVLAQQLLAQSMQSPQGLVSPSGTLNKALQGFLAGRSDRSQQQDQTQTAARQQGLAGALSRTGSADPAKAEAARRAAMIISGGLPGNPLAEKLLGAQAESAFAPPKGQTGQTGSLQEIAAINDYNRRKAAGKLEEGETDPSIYLSARRGTSADKQLYSEYILGLPEGEEPLPMNEFLVKHRGRVAGAERTAEESAETQAIPQQVGARTQAERFSTQIDEGYRAADALPIVARGLQLLDQVKTGGLASVQLAATNLFGITGADEAELSANLGKSVLSQLRSTFGAAFTEREGARLQEIEAGFGKSTEGNRRLLDQAKRLVERVANRGINAALKTGNQYEADEIRKAMSFSLSTDQPTVGGPQQGQRRRIRVDAEGNVIGD